MKSKVLPIIYCWFVFALSAFAQNKEARKIDEFGSLSCDDLISRLDNLANQVNKLPKSKGYIIVYEKVNT